MSRVGLDAESDEDKAFLLKHVKQFAEAGQHLQFESQRTLNASLRWLCLIIGATGDVRYPEHGWTRRDALEKVLVKVAVNRLS